SHYQRTLQWKEAEICTVSARDLDPSNVQYSALLAELHSQLGRSDATALLCKEILRNDTGPLDYHSAALFYLSHYDKISPAELAAFHRSYGSQISKRLVQPVF